MLSRPVTDTQITHRDRLWLYAVVGLVIVFMVLPCLIVIPMSFSASQYLEFPPRAWSLRWYAAYLGSPEWRAATVVSFEVGIMATILATVFGTLSTYGLFLSRSPVAAMLRGVLMLPMLVPLILIAIGAFFVYARLGLNSSMTGLVLAHAVLAIPFVIVAVGNGLKGYDFDQERVARSLGASRPVAFLTVTLPQIRVSVFSAMLFAFTTSFDEVVVANFIASGTMSTLPKRMFANIRDQVDPTVAAISSLLVLLSVVVLVLAPAANGRARPAP